MESILILWLSVLTGVVSWLCYQVKFIIKWMKNENEINQTNIDILKYFNTRIEILHDIMVKEKEK